MSADVAPSRARWIDDGPSAALPSLYSLVVSQYDPIHTPDAPRARGRRDLASAADAAGCEHARGINRSRRRSREPAPWHGSDLTGVPAGLVALRDHDVDTVLDVAARVIHPRRRARPPAHPSRARDR